MRSNRILYVLAIVFSVSTFVWTGSYLALAVGAAMFLLAILMLVGVLLTKALNRVNMHIPTSFAVGDDAFITMTLERGLHVSTALMVFELSFASSTFESTRNVRASVALNSQWRKRVQVPLENDRYGRLDIAVERCWCEDPLGLFHMSLPWERKANCIVHPAQIGLITNVTHVPLSRSFGDTYDDTRSGSDVDEIFDVREFQAGDHLASVHWKLSTRFDTMMSREFSRPVDFEMIVISLPSLADETGAPVETSILNGIASIAGAVSADFVQQGLAHNFAIPVNNVLENALIDGFDSLQVTSELILDAPISKTYADAVACLTSSEIASRFTKCILITPVYDDALWSQFITDLDLSVILVVSGSGANEVEGDYTLVVVDTEDTDNNERCITI